MPLAAFRKAKKAIVKGNKGEDPRRKVIKVQLFQKQNSQLG